jgi:phosphohistidine phosphatase
MATIAPGNKNHVLASARLALSRARDLIRMSAQKQLFILRHAKSNWDDPGLDDHERPLAPRGRRAVKLLARHIRDNHIEPAQVLCSSARRTRETCEGLAPSGELLIEPELYEASGGDVLDRLRRVPESAPSVMVIGHNPALQMLVLRLTGVSQGSTDHGDNRADTRLDDVQRKFPTGALATLTFDCPWSELSAGRAQLVDLVQPRDLH